MFKTSCDLFDTFDINETSISKKTNMRNYVKPIGVALLLLLFIFNNNLFIAQRTLTNDVAVKDSKNNVFGNIDNSSDFENYTINYLMSIPHTYGFDAKHEFTLLWPQLFKKHEEEIYDLYNRCDVNCSEQLEQLMEGYEVNALTIDDFIDQFEADQKLKKQCLKLWYVLSKLQEKSTTDRLINAINKSWLKEDGNLARTFLKMTKDEFLYTAYKDVNRTMPIVKKIDKLNLSL